MLHIEYFVPTNQIICFDTAENEPSEFFYKGLIRYHDNDWIL